MKRKNLPYVEERLRGGDTMNGFGDLEKQLRKIEQTIKKELDGGVPFGTLFDNSFMASYTKINTIDDFFSLSPFDIKTNEDLDTIDEVVLDKYVSENTSFRTWEAMKDKAGEKYMEKRLKKLL